MNGSRVVVVSSLGLCEHCGALISMENMPADSIDANWYCPKCKKLLTGASFGYKKIDKKWERIRWVDKEGKWVDSKPEEDFELEGLHVIPNALSPIY